MSLVINYLGFGGTTKCIKLSILKINTVCSVIILDEKIIGFLALLQGWYPTTSWKT
jgi:hypothetical protein